MANAGGANNRRMQYQQPSEQMWPQSQSMHSGGHRPSGPMAMHQGMPILHPGYVHNGVMPGMMHNMQIMGMFTSAPCCVAIKLQCGSRKCRSWSCVALSCASCWVPTTCIDSTRNLVPICISSGHCWQKYVHRQTNPLLHCPGDVLHRCSLPMQVHSNRSCTP